MKTNRKETIVTEIQYWKRSKLLPDEYCDFLLALYTEGSGEVRKGKRLHSQYVWLLGILILLPLSFLVIYFTQMPIILQTGLLSSFVAISAGYGWYLYRKTNEYFHIPLIVCLLIALIASVFATGKWTDSNAAIYVVVSIHSSIWIFLSKRLRLTYLLLSSFAGIIVMVGFLIVNR